MRALQLLLAFLPIASAFAESVVEFDTQGGDAWMHRMPISGRFAPARCDSVAIRSATMQIEALRIDDRFYAQVPLLPGSNPLQAVCRQNGREKAQSQTATWRARLPDLPKAWARVRVDGAAVHLDGGRSEPAPSLNAPLERFEWRSRPGNPTTLRATEGTKLDERRPIVSRTLQLEAPTRDGEYYVSLRVSDALGRSNDTVATFRVERGELRSVDLDSEHPAWLDAAVLYAAAPYMFEPQGFRGIEARLDHIRSLGASAIWISPVTAAASDDFGYAVTDQFSIREDFGDASALRSLIDAAHARGLRVLVDFVPNHFSQFHAYFVDAQRNGRRSAYYDWFDRDADGEVTQYFDWQHLKNLNFDNAAVRNHIIAAASRFIRDFDVDGFRIDASWAVAHRAPEFWPTLRSELKRVDPDIALIAEASALEPYHVSNGFDVAYDWTNKLGEWAWGDVFRSDGETDLGRLRAALTNGGRGLPADSLVLRFINNNDTGERFITRYGEHTARLGAALLFTLPGIPLIYNGDEVGAAFEPYDEGPPIQFQHTPLTDFYRKLAALRKSHDALRTREMKILKTNYDAQILSYVRPGGGEADDILVLLNFSDTAQSVAPGDVHSRAVFSSLGTAVNLLDDTRVQVQPDNSAVRVPAHGALVLRAAR
jgi:cyclomaltodextrinase / maltogenic alpha-amylase / neopullulanase